MLTLIGMGMTFAAIAVLVLGMYVMPVLIREKQPNENEHPEEVVEVGFVSAFDDESGSTGALRDQASAAAVAVALAEQAAEARYAAAAAAVAVAVALSPSMYRPEAAFAPAGAWNAYVRGQRLARRNLYNVRRSHHANLPRDHRR